MKEREKQVAVMVTAVCAAGLVLCVIAWLCWCYEWARLVTLAVSLAGAAVMAFVIGWKTGSAWEDVDARCKNAERETK